MRLSTLRLAAVLLPTALLLHELAYLLVPEGAPGAHGYLTAAVPLVAALSASLLAGALLMPLLRSRQGALADAGPGVDRRRPFALAGALIAVFATQELAEGLALGGGGAALAGALAALWLVLPLALALGVLAAAVIESLQRAGLAVARLGVRRGRRPATPPVAFAPPLTAATPLPHAPLAFGLARRPPPPAARLA